MYEIQTVSQPIASLYERFTFPYFRQLLKQENQDSIVAAAITYCGLPAGLCLTEISEDGQNGIIYSLFVTAHLRNSGLGRELLTFTEKILREKGCLKITIKFAKEQSLLLPIENLLKRYGWEEPELYSEDNKIDHCSLAKERWIYRYHLPPAYKVVPWSQVKQEKLTELKEQKWYPDYASPFMNHPKSILLTTSFWLYRRKEIVGWSVTRENKPDTIYFCTLFVMNELQGSGIGIPLLAETLKALFKTQLPFANFIFFHPSSGCSNTNLIRFAERRLKQFSLKTIRIWRVNKTLVPIRAGDQVQLRFRWSLDSI